MQANTFYRLEIIYRDIDKTKDLTVHLLGHCRLGDEILPTVLPLRRPNYSSHWTLRQEQISAFCHITRQRALEGLREKKIPGGKILEAFESLDKHTPIFDERVEKEAMERKALEAMSSEEESEEP